MSKLYHMPLSPFCRKLRLCLAEKKVDVQLIEEKYWLKTADFLQRSPAGKVPVLKIDQQIFTESTAICEYLEEKYPDPVLIPQGAMERYEMRRIIAWFDDKFYREVTLNLLHERVHRKLMGAGYPVAANVKAGMQAIKTHLDYMDDLLTHRRWLAGDVMTLADFAAAAHLSSLDYISDVDWNRSAAVKDWYVKLKSRPAFRSLLMDMVPGFPPPRHYTDLDF